MTTGQLRRASQAVQLRMSDRGMSAAQLARAAGVSPNTIRGLTQGRTWPIATTRVLIEQALGWRTGEIYRRATQAGAHPRPGLERFTIRDLLIEILQRIDDQG
jgi:transcriptional regulator with XRE-family HTH domain